MNRSNENCSCLHPSYLHSLSDGLLRQVELAVDQLPLGALREEEGQEAEGDGRDHGGDHKVPPVGEDVGEEGEGEPAHHPRRLAADPDDGLQGGYSTVSGRFTIQESSQFLGYTELALYNGPDQLLLKSGLC